MKWIKRIFLLLSIAIILVIGAALVGIHKYRQAPDWYHARHASEAQRKSAAHSADQKFADVFSWAAAVQARQIRSHRGATRPDDPPIPPKAVVLTEDEINAFFERNWGAFNLNWQQRVRDKLSRNFTEGRIVLLPGEIVLAGQSKDLGTVVSAPIHPSIDSQGQLMLQMEQIQAGRLPLPRTVLASRIDQLHGLLEDQLLDNQNGATVDENFVANGPAVAAALVRVLLDMLDDRSSPPIAFIPFDLSHPQRMLAVRINSISVTDGTLNLTLDALADNQQSTLLQEIRRAYILPTEE